MADFNNTNLADFSGVWVFCEQRQGELQPTVLELAPMHHSFVFYAQQATRMLRKSYLCTGTERTHERPCRAVPPKKPDKH